jgi:XrtN system VIT domain protein
MRIRFIGADTPPLPREFQYDDNGQFIKEGMYQSGFDLSFPSVPLRENHFAWNGQVYSLESAEPRFDSTVIKRIYLDINNTWTDAELKRCNSLLQYFSTYVIRDGERIKLTAENWKKVTSQLKSYNFSLFPFYKIEKEIGQTLVITKGSVASPHIKDFKETPFGKKAREFFSGNEKVNVFNLGHHRSNYLNTLIELRAIRFASGNVDDLQELLLEQKFPVQDENDNRVFLHDADFVITKSDDPGTFSENNAPDHLARLFAYNNIMRKTGERYFTDAQKDHSLVAEASEAYVVSPVSSLIVLETQEDYNRFDIHDSGNSLLNASKQSSGAVPEPHEWALIILFILLILFANRKFLKARIAV